MSRLPLPDRQIDLWYVLLDKIADSALYDAYRDLLSSEETRRERRLAHQESRRQFLVGRALLRTTLSQYTGHDPRGLEFTCNRYGKPALKTLSDLPLEFSLSHTCGMVVCAVALRDPLGVDVEQDGRVSEPLELARRFFAPAEAAALENLPPGQQRPAFLQLWTLKEAFAKARGVGLAAPPASVVFSLSPDRLQVISSIRLEGEQPSDWQFAQLRLVVRYHVALAAGRPASQRSAIMLREAVPLRWQGTGRLLPETEWS